MELQEYRRLADYESWYWWYRAQRQHLLELVRAIALPPGARILDAGCGTGRNLIELSNLARTRAYGVDAAPGAVACWNGSNGVCRVQGSINDLPYASGRFDLVLSIDVLGCAGVERQRAIQEMARVLATEGRLILFVPAYAWMRSTHDVAVHSVHRFTARELKVLVASAGLKMEHLAHQFALFFPIIAAARLARKLRPHANGSARSDLAPLPRWLNQGLYRLARMEQRVTRRMPAPFGSTIVLIAGKGPR